MNLGGIAALAGGIAGGIGDGLIEKHQEELQAKVRQTQAITALMSHLGDFTDEQAAYIKDMAVSSVVPSTGGAPQQGKKGATQGPPPNPQARVSSSLFGLRKVQYKAASQAPQTENVPTPGTSTSPFPKVGQRGNPAVPVSTSAMPDGKTYGDIRQEQADARQLKQRKDEQEQAYQTKLSEISEQESSGQITPEEAQQAKAALVGVPKPTGRVMEGKIEPDPNQPGKYRMPLISPSGEILSYREATPPKETPKKTPSDVNASIDNYFKLKKWNPDPMSPDYAAHWQEAHQAYTNETKTGPGVARMATLGKIRGPSAVFDTQTGTTKVMNWDDYNRLNEEEPDRYVAAQYSPEALAGAGAGRELAPDKIGSNVQSYGTFIRHTGNLFDAISTLKNSNYPDMNKSINWLRNHSGDPRVKVFLAKLEPVQKEFESFLLNNRALYESDRQAAAALVDENSSPATMLQVLPSIVQTGSERLSEADAAYGRATQGKHIPNLITPEAGAVLKKLGITSPMQGTNGNGAGKTKLDTLPERKSGTTRIKASDGTLHDIPTQNLAKARKIDPKLQVIQ